jgi:hypothetical protein
MSLTNTNPKRKGSDMLEPIYNTFSEVLEDTKTEIRVNSSEVHTDRWQGWDIKGRPDYVTYELLNFGFKALLPSEDLQYYRDDIQPQLPWCDNHFLERVGGHPINPGVEWANWKWGAAAAKHRAADEKFNHNYMERFWPKHARQDCLTPEGRIPEGVILNARHQGIAHQYGDLRDLVDYLVKEPTTRQAWIPLFFPEDTGFGDGGRKPCTLGYQFIVRDKKLHVYYPLRSCDFVRHFRDDIYLAVRLLLWILEECRKQDPETWNQVTPGTYTMHCTSLHIFTNDWVQLFGKARGK